jgi:hypothetical protein
MKRVSPARQGPVRAGRADAALSGTCSHPTVALPLAHFADLAF